MEAVAPVTQRGSDDQCRASVWRVLFEPVAVYAFAIVLLMRLACTAFGAALTRVVFERILQHESHPS